MADLCVVLCGNPILPERGVVRGSFPRIYFWDGRDRAKVDWWWLVLPLAPVQGEDDLYDGWQAVRKVAVQSRQAVEERFSWSQFHFSRTDQRQKLWPSKKRGDRCNISGTQPSRMDSSLMTDTPTVDIAVEGSGHESGGSYSPTRSMDLYLVVPRDSPLFLLKACLDALKPAHKWILKLLCPKDGFFSRYAGPRDQLVRFCMTYTLPGPRRCRCLQMTVRISTNS